MLDELHEQRTHSAEIVAAKEAEIDGLLRDSGDGAGHDQADVGASSFERDHELNVLSNELDKLAQIERALARSTTAPTACVSRVASRSGRCGSWLSRVRHCA